jgi:hypothetical protein
VNDFSKKRISRALLRCETSRTPALARRLSRVFASGDPRNGATGTTPPIARREIVSAAVVTRFAKTRVRGSSDVKLIETTRRSLARDARRAARKRLQRARSRSACAALTDCFGREIKKARGRCPAPLENYLFLAVLRRAVPVFFAVVFFAAAVLRAGFFFAGFFFATAMMHPSFGLAGC